MVVWQGITSGGTAVPVQVDDQGRVVAQGIDGKDGQDGQDGATGPEGPQGPQGPEGPAGADGLWREVNSRLIMPAGNTSVQVGMINLDQGGAATIPGTVASQSWFQSTRTDASQSFLYGKLDDQETVNITANGGAQFGINSQPQVLINSAYGVFVKPVAASDGGEGGDSLWQGYGNNGTNITSKITADGSSLFKGKAVFDTRSFGGPAPAIEARANTLDTSHAPITAYNGNNNGGCVYSGYGPNNDLNWYMDNRGNSYQAGTVSSRNISAFSVVLKKALLNSDTVQDIKTALTEALDELVPPDAPEISGTPSTMPAPPDVSTMPAPPDDE